MSLFSAIPGPSLIQTRAPQHARSIQEVNDELPHWQEVFETLTLRGGYNTTMVVLGTTLLGLAAGVIGVFALLRKRSLMTDTLSHATLPGITLAFIIAGLLGMEGKSVGILLLGGTVSAVFGVLCVQIMLRSTRLREDAAMGIVLSVFFGAGIVGLSYIQANAPTDSAGLNHFIYGQAATMQSLDVMVMGGLALGAILCTMLLLKEFTIVCFQDTFARVEGWPVGLVDTVMMGLVVLVTIAGLQAVGIILVVSMLIIPPVAARFWTDRLWVLLILSGVIGAGSAYLGAVLSALFPRKPAGAVIVLTAGGVFAISMLLAPRRGVLARVWRRVRLSFRIAGDHLLEHCYVQGHAELTTAQLQEYARRQGWSRAYTLLLSAQLRRGGMLAGGAGGPQSPTETGRRRGARVARNHALWEQYLISYADIAPSHVDWSVDRVEHILSDQLIRELEIALQSRGIEVPSRGGGGIGAV